MSSVPTPDHRPTPDLTTLDVPREARAVALVLHGGAVASTREVDGRSLSFRRARHLLREVRGPLRASGIGVAQLRFAVVGWNAGRASEPSPVTDARWALDQIATTTGLPVLLVGHSMGARTGAAVANHPSVRGLVALAPWFPEGEPVGPLRGKSLRAAHGHSDRITSARATRDFVARASALHPPADAAFTDMGAVGHYLLRGRRAWNTFTVDACRELIDQRTA